MIPVHASFEYTHNDVTYQVHGIWVDNGIGAYEFWGSPGNDVRVEFEVLEAYNAYGIAASEEIIEQMNEDEGLQETAGEHYYENNPTR